MEVITKLKWKIKDLLIQKGMSIYELAERADVTEACIRNWYTKRNYTPSLEAIIKVCAALEIPIAELFREEDDEQVYVNKDERQILSSWASLNDKQKKAIKTILETFMDN